MKKGIKTVFTVIGKILLIVLSFAIVLTGVAFIYNKIQCGKEERFWIDTPGQMVEVDGHKMHIYSEGEGDHTIVFLSGWGDTSPYANFLPLCKELSADARVVILERFGYGLSDTVEGERTFDKILEEDREGLKKAGIEGPYVLAPHSIAGADAILWAQKYPDEVEGIVGLDISVPSMREEYVKESDFPKTIITEIKILKATGLYRFMLDKPEDETDRMYIAIACRQELNKTKLDENGHLVEALDEIESMPYPTVPTVQYVAKQNCDMFPEWEPGHQVLVDASENGKLIVLDCGHYVYKEKPEEIVDGIREFIKNL
ncbi:alpha/beta fold hydrolase [Butyrivibrio sp. INlla21]|uniref:alpha/beta fold hydrolase n=1 Tax=Butyrivibrio sp. INlla21 TaxID=1520811 RepID=UPI0008E53902|nr:alpha/beta hydrolase [Butyrivibrio sp. INlla21]SFV01488.1 Pimeloyl-ACP methyl ester carboxylesterase [Butyrivibrio sp. INlla21]